MDNIFSDLMKNAAELMVNINFVVFYCLLIFGAGIFNAKRYNDKLTPAGQSLTKLFNIVDKTRGVNDFHKVFEELDEEASKCSIISNSWREFKETILWPDPENNDKRIIRNTRLPSRYFTHKSILWDNMRMNIRYYNALPNIFTGLGILGTFLGLVAGIYLAQSGGLLGDNPQQMKGAIKQLLGGASLAFVTSVAGLVSSIIFSMFEKAKIHEFDYILNTWTNSLDERLQYTTVDTLANLALLENRKQTKALQSFSNDLAVTLGELMANNVAGPLNETLQKIHAVLEDQKNRGTETIEKILQEFKVSIRLLIEEFKIGLTGGATEGIEKAGEKFSAVASELTELVARLAGTMETISESLSEASSDFNTSVQNLIASLNSFTSLAVKMDDATSELMDVIADIKVMETGMAENINTQKVTSENMLTVAGEVDSSVVKSVGLIEKIKDITSEINDVVKNLEKSWESHLGRFENVDEELAGVVTNLQNGLRSYVKTTSDFTAKLDEHSSEIVRHLAGAANELDGSIGDLGEMLKKATNPVKNIHVDENGNTVSNFMDGSKVIADREGMITSAFSPRPDGKN